MKRNTIAFLAVMSSLYGCSGGSGPTAPINSVPETTNPAIAIPVATAGIFEAAPTELPIFNDYFIPKSDTCTGAPSIVSVVDLNKDGRKDLVVHMWCGLMTAGLPKTDPTPDSLIVFIQRSNGKFEYANEEVFGTKDVRFQSATRKVSIADFNNDGYLDLAYATNMEDGRQVNTSGSTQYATPAIMLSTGNGKYKIDKIGEPGWYHSVDAVKNNSGGYDVLFSGFGSSQPAFRYSNGSWQAVTSYPKVSGGTFKFSPEGTIVVTSATPDWTQNHNPASMIKLELSNNSWVKTGESIIQGTYVPYVTWQNSLASVFATSTDNALHVSAGYDESCFLKLTPTETVYVARYSAEVLPPNYTGSTPAVQGSVPFISRFDTFKVNQSFEKMPSIITNEDLSAGFSFFSCKDVNNDGYEDIVVASLNKQGTPVFYINNKQGKLVKVDTTDFPKAPDSYGTSTNLYEDLNNDGVPDLLIWSSFSSTPPRLHKGIKSL
jgi:hypothetical protein